MAAIRTFFANLFAGNDDQQVAAPPGPTQQEATLQLAEFERHPVYLAALVLNPNGAALTQQVDMARTALGVGNYRSVGRFLVDAEQQARLIVRRLEEGPIGSLHDTARDGNRETVLAILDEISAERTAELAASLDLHEFQDFLIKIRGHGQGRAMINSLPRDRVEALLTANGVDAAAIARRGAATGQNAESLQRRAVELTLLCPDIAAELMSDLAFCGEILSDATEALRRLEPLEQALAGGGQVAADESDEGGADEDARPSLSQALREKEVAHCFPDVDSVPVGILSGETFLGMTAWGYTPKDPGAGLEHGEFTHRLQWNALMNRFEHDEGNDDTAWQHTPFELYTMIGEIDERGAGQGHASAWGLMMDTAGGNQPANAGAVADMAGGFALPDNVTAAFRVLADADDGPNSRLAEIVARRFDKRFRQTQEQIEAITVMLPQLQQEFAELREACHTGQAGARQNLDDWFAANRVFLNVDQCDLDAQQNGAPFPHVTFKNHQILLYDLYMEDYKRQKLADARYKLVDEAHPEDLLLVGVGEIDLSDEEKRGRVLELRARSRVTFGKEPVWGAAEQAEVARRLAELAAAATALDENVDQATLADQANVLGPQRGLGAVIDFLEEQHAAAADLATRWKAAARNVVREIRRLQNRLRATRVDEDARAADRIEDLAMALQQPPNAETRHFLEHDPLIAELERNDDEAYQIDIRAPLLAVLG